MCDLSYTCYSFPGGFVVLGDIIYGRVMVDPVQNLGDSFICNIEKVFLCTGADGYVPKYNPENLEYGCLADAPSLLYRFKIIVSHSALFIYSQCVLWPRRAPLTRRRLCVQDKAQPETQATTFGSINFNAFLAVDDSGALALVRQPGSDGFRVDSAPLFQVRGIYWLVFKSAWWKQQKFYDIIDPRSLRYTRLGPTLWHHWSLLSWPNVRSRWLPGVNGTSTPSTPYVPVTTPTEASGRGVSSTITSLRPRMQFRAAPLAPEGRPPTSLLWRRISAPKTSEEPTSCTSRWSAPDSGDPTSTSRKWSSLRGRSPTTLRTMGYWWSWESVWVSCWASSCWYSWSSWSVRGRTRRRSARPRNAPAAPSPWWPVTTVQRSEHHDRRLARIFTSASYTYLNTFDLKILVRGSLVCSNLSKIKKELFLKEIFSVLKPHLHLRCLSGMKTKHLCWSPVRRLELKRILKNLPGWVSALNLSNVQHTDEKTTRCVTFILYKSIHLCRKLFAGPL